jgi:acetyl-CoA C-acetyltransferase
MQIQTGISQIVAAGGVESMSTAEFYIPGNIKWGIGRGAGIAYPDSPRGHGSLSMFGIPLYDRIQRSRAMHHPAERFGEIISNVTWAETAARDIGLTREECDRWALRSHQKAVAAQKSGKFKEYIVPITVPQEKGRESEWIPMKDPAQIHLWKRWPSSSPHRVVFALPGTRLRKMMLLPVLF